LRKFAHVILTRYNLGLYDKPGAEEWMWHRWRHFQKTRDSVLSQEGEFTWVLCMDERTPDSWVDRIFTDLRMEPFTQQPKEYRRDGWTITTRLDNDDILMPGAVQAIQSKFREKEVVLDMRYWQAAEGRIYTSGRETPNSPFLSLIENGVKRTCYARPHSYMISEYPAMFVSDEPLAIMVIHDRNLGNRIVGRLTDPEEWGFEQEKIFNKYL